MPKYIFDLPVNKKRAVVDAIEDDARIFGAVCNSTPRFRLLSMDKFIYQVVIDNLTEADASYLILKHDLTLVRTEMYYD